MFTPVIKLEYADARGEIYSIALPGDKELMLLHSTKGSLRGGHAHDVDEIIVLLTGAMRYTKKAGKISTEWGEILEGGEASTNERGVYHLAEFLEDTWLLEWKIDTTKNGWKNIDYPEWRERVKANAANSG